MKLSKYDADLKRDIVIETNDPAEINKYRWGYGYKEVKPIRSQPAAQAAGKKTDKDDK